MINQEMRAAFPKEELSEGAERLLKRMRTDLNDMLDGNRSEFFPGTMTDEEMENKFNGEIIAAIVTELGITENLVEALRAHPENFAATRAATALATFLEVAGK